MRDEFNIEQLLGKNKEPEICKEEELNAKEKERILHLALNKIEALPKGSANTSAFRKTRKLGTRLARILPAAGIALALITGTYASASIFHLDEKFSEFFHSKEEDVNKEQVYIRNDAGLTQTKNNVTLTVDQILGDDYSFYILYHLEGIDAKNATPVIKSSDISMNVTDYQFDEPIFEKEEDGKFYYIQTVRTDENMSGKEINLHVNKIGYYEKKKFVPLTDASFHLTWKLNYKITSDTMDVQKKVHIYGGSATLDKMSISPLSVTVHLNNIKSKRECKNPNDELIVKMKDGTIFDSYDNDSVDVYNDFDVITVGFHNIIKSGDIESITFAGETIPINQ